MKFCEQLSLFLVIAMRTRSKLKRLKELLNHAKWAAPHVMLCLARNAQKLLLVADHSTVQFLLWKHLHFRCQAIHELPKTSITKLNAVLKKTNEKEQLHRCSVRDASFTWCQARVFFITEGCCGTCEEPHFALHRWYLSWQSFCLAAALSLETTQLSSAKSNRGDNPD